MKLSGGGRVGWLLRAWMGRALSAPVTAPGRGSRAVAATGVAFASVLLGCAAVVRLADCVLRSLEALSRLDCDWMRAACMLQVYVAASEVS